VGTTTLRKKDEYPEQSLEIVVPMHTTWRIIVTWIIQSVNIMKQKRSGKKLVSHRISILPFIVVQDGGEAKPFLMHG